MKTAGDEVLNENDLTSINAIVHYTSSISNFNEDNYYFLLENEFKVSRIKDIKRCNLDRAIALLVDLTNVCIN